MAIGLPVFDEIGIGIGVSGRDLEDDAVFQSLAKMHNAGANVVALTRTEDNAVILGTADSQSEADQTGMNVVAFFFLNVKFEAARTALLNEEPLGCDVAG